MMNGEQNGVTSATLKWVAVITMFLDHCGAVVLARVVSAERIRVDFWHFFQMPGVGKTYIVLRAIGRIAFPLYLFMMVEGVKYTKNIYKYLLRIGLFAVLSEIAFDMALWLKDDEVFSGRLVEFSHQNVYITLFICLAMFIGFRELERRFGLTPVYLGGAAVLTGLGCLLGWLTKCDYGYAGVLAAAVLYIFKEQRAFGYILAIAELSFLSSHLEWFALFGLFFVMFYNGQKGKSLNKYFFYLFYPAHFLLLWGICIFSGLLK